MKAKELMIGDWVAFRGHPYQYTANDIATMAECEAKGVSTDTTPVPLTEEILLANGFEFVEAEKLSEVRLSLCHLSRMTGEYRFLNKTRNGFVNDCIMLGYSYMHKDWHIIQMFGKDAVIAAGIANYVHELQHAMRLCGINKEITL